MCISVRTQLSECVLNTAGYHGVCFPSNLATAYAWSQRAETGQNLTGYKVQLPAQGLWADVSPGQG